MSNKKIKAILIDADNQEVKDVELEPRLDNIYKQLGNNCDCFTCVNLHDGDVMYVDDEGLLKDNVLNGFFYGNSPWYAGNGLVIGTNRTGDSADTKLSADDIPVEFRKHTKDTKPAPSWAVYV